MKPEEVSAVRNRLGLNTSDFGALIGVSGRTIESWEQGRNTPRGPALVLLKRLAKKKKPRDRR